jgi:hypothetical protein
MLRINPIRRVGDTSASRRVHRQHRASLRQLDRSALERAGWRTTLEFRENHVRSASGQLIEIETLWVAEAERPRSATADSHNGEAGAVDVVRASARSESRAWARLLGAAESAGRNRVQRREPERLRATG